MTVQVEGVRVRFGEVLALDGVDLALRPGCVHALVGPNGAGKSTLLGVLLGLVRPDEGTLLLEGARYDLARATTPMSLRERLGYLPEAVAFAETLTGRQVIGFFARARGVPSSRCDLLLERVGLAAAARRPVRGYSRGMRQRLGLAIALIAEPRLLVLDEPTGGLDQEGLTLLWQVLTELRGQGRTVVLTTHDLAVIERRTDELVVLAAGRCVARGSPDGLRQQVALPARLRVAFTEAEAARSFAARLAEAGREGAFADDRTVQVVAASRDLVHLAGLVKVEADVEHVRVEEAGLDEVYDQLLRGVTP